MTNTVLTITQTYLAKRISDLRSDQCGGVVDGHVQPSRSVKALHLGEDELDGVVLRAICRIEHPLEVQLPHFLLS